MAKDYFAGLPKLNIPQAVEGEKKPAIDMEKAGKELDALNEKYGEKDWGDTFSGGMRNTQSFMAGDALHLGGMSKEDYAKVVSENTRINEEKTQNKEKLRLQKDIEDAEGFLDTTGEVLASPFTNPEGLGRFVVEQAGNMVPSMVGGLGGAAAGSLAGPVGTVVGGLGGMSAGTIATETGAELVSALQDMGVDLKNENEIVKALTPGAMDEALKRGLIRGATIATVDILTMGASKFLMGIPGKNLVRSLSKKGFDVSDPAAAIRLARESSDESVHQLMDVYAKSKKPLGRAKSAIAPFALEVAGEPAGEALAQAAVGDEIDGTEVALEALGGLGASVASTGITSAYSNAKSFAVQTKRKPSDIPAIDDKGIQTGWRDGGTGENYSPLDVDDDGLPPPTTTLGAAAAAGGINVNNLGGTEAEAPSQEARQDGAVTADLEAHPDWFQDYMGEWRNIKDLSDEDQARIDTINTSNEKNVLQQDLQESEKTQSPTERKNDEKLGINAWGEDIWRSPDGKQYLIDKNGEVGRPQDYNPEDWSDLFNVVNKVEKEGVPIFPSDTTTTETAGESGKVEKTDTAFPESQKETEEQETEQADKITPSGKVSFQLKNGNTVTGTVTKVDGEVATIKVDGHGTVKRKTENLTAQAQEVEQKPANTDAPFEEQMELLAQGQDDQAADWASREYKDNQTRAELKGDGPVNSPDISISAINAGKKRKRIAMHKQNAKGIRKAAAMGEEKLLTEYEKLKEKFDSIPADNRFGQGKLSDEEYFETWISDKMLGTGSSFGKGSASNLVRTALEPMAQKRKATKEKTKADEAAELERYKSLTPEQQQAEDNKSMADLLSMTSEELTTSKEKGKSETTHGFDVKPSSMSETVTPLPKSNWGIVRNGEVLTSGNSVGTSVEYLDQLMDQYGDGASVLYSDSSFSVPETLNTEDLIVGKTWGEIDALQQKKSITKINSTKIPEDAAAIPEKQNTKDVSIETELVDGKVKRDTEGRTEAQKEAGNYKMKHVKWNGLDISIENEKGSTRSGTDEDGKAWEVTMKNEYGYIKRTKGADGDHVDIFIGSNADSDKVFIVNQTNKDGTFDEHKVLYGFNSKDDAEIGYLDNYENGWNNYDDIVETDAEGFKEWLDKSSQKKPANFDTKIDQSEQAEVKKTEKMNDKPVIRKNYINGRFGKNNIDWKKTVEPYDIAYLNSGEKYNAKEKDGELKYFIDDFATQAKTTKTEKPKQEGKKETVITPSGMEVETQFEVVETDKPTKLTKAQNQFDKDMAELGSAIFEVLSMKVIPSDRKPEFTRLLTNVMGSALNLGYTKFRENAKYVLDVISKKFGKDAADLFDLQMLQGAYLGATSGEKGAETINDVANITLEDIKKTEVKEDGLLFNNNNRNVETGGVKKSGTKRSAGSIREQDQKRKNSGDSTGTKGKPATIKRTATKPNDKAGDRSGAVEYQGRSRTDVRNNYTIESQDELASGSAYQIAKSNLDAVKIAKRIASSDNDTATIKEQSILARYAGWGASEIRNKVFPKNNKPEGRWKEIYDQLDDLLMPDEIKTLKKSTQYAHYTSKNVIDAIYKAVEGFGFKVGSVFEGGVGSGNFMGLLPKIFNVPNYIGIEMDSVTADIAQALYPNNRIIKGDFTKINLPQNHFDLVIGNPPFADVRYPLGGHKMMIHDYMIAKQLDALKPGAVGSFVTSTGTMDKVDSTVREYIDKNSVLLGAIRLPNDTFKESAGTSVTTDILFFQKRDNDNNAIKGVNWIDTDQLSVDGQLTNINSYFIKNHNQMLGDPELGGTFQNRFSLKSNGNTEKQLNNAIDALPKNIISENPTIEEVQKRMDEFEIAPEVADSYFYIDEKGNTRINQGGVGVSVANRKQHGRGKTAKQMDMVRDYIPLRNALMKVMQNQNNDEVWNKAVKELNVQYDLFTKNHGPLNQVREIKRKDGVIIYQMPITSALEDDAEFFRVLTTEQYNEVTGKGVKGDVFTDQLFRKDEPVQINSAEDALSVTLNEKGYLDMLYMQEIYNQSEKDIISELGRAIYADPLTGQYITADEYLSGNVKAKLRQAEESGIQRNIADLKKVIPEDKPLSEIPINLGAFWIKPETVRRFAEEKLDFTGKVSNVIRGENSSWSVVGTAENTSEFGTAEKNPAQILDAALNRRTIKITTKDRDDKTIVLVAESTAANEKIKALRDAFSQWSLNDAQASEEMYETYNRDFNTTVPRKYNGDMLTLPGLSSKYALHNWQKNVVWRIIQNGNTYMAHTVGSGKTLASIVAGMELKRLGLAKKPAYVVLKSTLKQFASEFYDAYPNAKLLIADENQLNKRNRRHFMGKVSNESWDAVIITHQSFEKIPMGDQFIKDYIEKQIAEYESTLDELDETDLPNRRNIENTIEKMEAQLEEIAKGEDKDKGVIFEDSGIDQLFVDEAHTHKKVQFPTTQNDLKGIDPTGSKIAMDLFLKSRYLNTIKPNKNLVMMSGTAVTNTINEFFNIQRFLQPDVLESQGISSFDSWSSTFAESSTSYEMKANGKFHPVTRLNKFVGLPGFLRDFLQVADIVGDKELEESTTIKNRPTLKNNARDIQAVPIGESMKGYMFELDSRIKALENKKGPPKKGEDNILVVMNDGQNAAIDMRLVNKVNDVPSKLNVMIDEAFNSWEEMSDAEYHTNGKPDPIKGNVQLIFTKTRKSSKSPFDVYNHIRDTLISKGVPASEIAFIQNYGDSKKKKRLFNDVNNGKIRFVLGGTTNLGTGTNVQKRLSKIHHLSIDYRPSDLKQREGRMIRQGNQNKDVESIAYAAEGTIDAFMWGMLENKAAMIDKAMAGNLSINRIADVSDDANMLAMAKAIASGNPALLEIAELSSDVKRLRMMESSYTNQRFNARGTLKKTEHSKEQINYWEEETKNLPPYKETVGDNFNAELAGNKYIDRKKFLDALNALPKQRAGLIGKVGNQEIFINNSMQISFSEGNDTVYVQAATLSNSYNLNIAPVKLTGSLSHGAIKRLENIARKYSKVPGDMNNELSKVSKREENAQRILNSEFDKTAELNDKSVRLLELEDSLKSTPESTETNPDIDNEDKSRTDIPKFSKKAKQISVEDFSKQLENELGLKTLHLFTTNKGDLKLDTIIVDKNDRKQGKGTEALNRITQYADENGLRVILSPAIKDDYQGTTSRGRLVKFYKKFGFKENKGRNKDFTLSESMFRPIPIKYSKKTGDQTGQTKSQLEASLKDQLGKYRNINILEKQSNLSQEILDQLEPGETINGFYNPETGEITLIAENISAKDSATILKHEVFHKVLKNSPAYQEALKELDKQKGTEFYKKAEKAAQDSNTAEKDMQEEIAAYYFQNGKTLPFVKRMIAKFKAFIRQYFNIEMTTEDLNYTLTEMAKGNIDYGERMDNGAIKFHKNSDNALKKWFGNSKVVDNNDNPLIVYHGTSSDIETFKGKGKGKLGKGDYFTPSLSKANVFAKIRKDKPSIMPVYVRVENPYIIDGFFNIPLNGVSKEKLMKQGYDGVILKENGKILEVVIYSSNQVKSAIGNVGEFSTTDDRIAYSKVSEKQSQIKHDNFSFTGVSKPAGLTERDVYKIINEKYGRPLYGLSKFKNIKIINDKDSEWRGKYSPRTEKITLNAYYLSKEDAVRVLHHEKIHEQIKNDKQLKRIGDKILAKAKKYPNSAAGKALEIAKRRVDKNATDYDRRIYEETLAYLIQYYNKPGHSSVLKEFINTIRKFFAKRFGMFMNESDAVDYVSKMVRAEAQRVGFEQKKERKQSLYNEKKSSDIEADLVAQFEGADDLSGLDGKNTKKRVTGTNTSWADEKGFEGLDQDTLDAVAHIGKPPNQDLKDVFKDKLNELKYRWSNKLRQGMVDQYDSFKSILNDTRAWMMANLSNSSHQAVVSAVTEGSPFLHKSGALDLNSEKKSLSQVLEPLGEEADRFMMWIAGNRAYRINQKSKAASIQSAALKTEAKRLDALAFDFVHGNITKSGRTDIFQLKSEARQLMAQAKKLDKKAQVKERLFSEEYMAKLKALNGNNNGEFRSDREKIYNKALKDFESLHNDIVQIGVDTGLVSREDADLWAEQGFYVPFYRLAEDMDNTKGPVSVGGLVRQDAYKKLKGANLQLNDLIGNTLMNWNHIISGGLKNQAAKTALESAVDMGVAKKIKNGDGNKNAIFVRKNGEKSWYEIIDDQDGNLIMSSLTSLNYEGLNTPSMKVLRKFKRALTMGVIASPEFKFANLTRDSLQALSATDIGMNPIANITQGWKATSKESKTIGRMNVGGGAFETSGFLHGADPDSIRLELKKGIQDSAVRETRNVIQKAWEKYQDFGARLENVNRAANFEQNLKDGMDLLEANFNSRDHLDFMRTGSFLAVRILAQTVPFLNARLQGLDKMNRAVLDPKQRMQFLTVMATYTMASLALYLMMKDDDDYKDAEQWERDTYHLFKIPGTEKMGRLPRPFEMGVIASMAERMLEQVVDDEVHGALFGERLLHAILETFAMNPMPQAFKPAAEIYSNKSFFTGRGIESMSMRNLPTEDRRKFWTTQTAIGLSKAMDTVLWDKAVLSPVQIDHIIQGYLGWAGAFITGSVDQVLRPITGRSETPDRRIEDYPVVGRFIRESKARNSKYTPIFYDNLRKVNQINAAIRLYRKEQDIEKMQELFDNNIDKLKYRAALNRANKKLTAINTRINLTNKSRKLSSTEKADKLAVLYEKKNNLLEKAVRMTDGPL